MVPLHETRLDSLGYRQQQGAEIWHFALTARALGQELESAKGTTHRKTG
jgi:hypothetical protein